MNIMSIDAEYNQPSRKTIQVGAAVFDAVSGAMIDKLEMYVNPNELINPEIIELTGIKDSDVKNGITIEEAYRELERFHKKYKCFRNPLVWGSGNRNDSSHIHEESGVKEENFMGFRVLDVKTIHQSVQIYKNKKHGGGLKEICEDVLKIGFDGEVHTALADAINTFKVWHYYVRGFR